MKMIRGRFRAAVLMGAAASVLAFAAGANGTDIQTIGNGSNDNTWPYATTGRSPVLAVVGDIACQPGETEPTGEKAGETCDPRDTPTAHSLWQSQEATANQIETMKPDAVALLGDLQYQVGQYSDFEQSFDLTYGAFKFITRPAPGNHEFYDEHSETGVAGYGYFSYFNGFQHNADGSTVTATIARQRLTPAVPSPNPCRRRMDRRGTSSRRADSEPHTGGGPVGVGDGWYSYNLGTWHLISLNIECETQPGGCSNTGSWFAAELAWLKNDLAANHSACTARLLAPALVQRCRQRHLTRGPDRSGLLATALQVRSRPGAERTRPPLCPLPPP